MMPKHFAEFYGQSFVLVLHIILGLCPALIRETETCILYSVAKQTYDQ